MGHSMGASGGLETIACLKMLEEGVLLPTQNLEKLDGRCAPLSYVRTQEQRPVNIIVKNSFAIGGNNCTAVIRRPL